MQTNSKKTLTILVIVVIFLVLIWAALSATRQSAVPVSSTASSSMVTASSTGPTKSVQPVLRPSGVSIFPATTSESSLPQGALIYGISTDKESYTQDEVINILVVVINNTLMPKTFNSPNGCQATYSIGSFNMLDHTVCLPNPTSFTVAAHSQQSIKLAHYPSAYKLPVGTYTLTASIVGGGGSSKQVTITQ